MIKKIIAFLLTAVIALCTLSACGGDDDISLIMPIESDPLCLDPQIAETDEAKLIVNNCFEGLVRLDKDGKIIGGVAEKWTVSPDGLVYTFTLREGTNWQLLKSYKDVLEDENYLENFDTEVTAYDFVFGLRRAADKITDSPDAEKLYCIKNAQKIHLGEADKSTLGVTAKDKKTLVITLERANPDFLRILTLPLCMPCNEEFFNATHAKYGLALEYTFCNGPFYLARWAEDNSLVMYRNEGYVGAQEVIPTAVYFNVNSDEESVVSKLKQLTYHCAYISDSAAYGLEDNKKISRAVTENEVVGLAFNCTDSVLQNENLRRAIVMMTDTAQIAKPEKAIGTAQGIIPGCCRYADSDYRTAAGRYTAIGCDEAQAADLWSKGLKEIEAESAGIKIICTEEYAAQMQAVIQKWQKNLSTSIVAKVEVVSEDGLKDAIKNDKYQIAVTGITAQTASVTDTLEFFTSTSSKNIFNYSDENYDKLYDEILCVRSGDAVLDAMKQAENMLAQKAVFCPLFTFGDYIAISNESTGLAPTPAFESISFINGGLD